MKKMTKNYLTFCGINTITYIILFNKFYNKLKKEEYEIVDNKKSFEDFIYFVIRMITPLYNCATTAQLMLILDNSEFYMIIKNRMISRNLIQYNENNINDTNKINEEQPYRNYTKIKRNSN